MESNIKHTYEVTPMLLRVANTILSNYSMTTTPNLTNGRMGVCLFLYEYARFTGIKEYEDIADDMIDLILKVLHKGQNEDNISSLSGIGIGVIYLITHQFLEDTDEHDSLEEVDKLLLNTIESALMPSEVVVQSALYFIYRFSYYRIGLDRKYCHKLAQKLVKLFQDHKDSSEIDSRMSAYILRNAAIIFEVSQNPKMSTFEYNTILLDVLPLNVQNQITAERIWHSILFGGKDFGSGIDENCLLNLCQNCFYDADRIIGILCGYGLIEMKNINLSL